MKLFVSVVCNRENCLKSLHRLRKGEQTDERTKSEATVALRLLTHSGEENEVEFPRRILSSVQEFFLNLEFCCVLGKKLFAHVYAGMLLQVSVFFSSVLSHSHELNLT